MAGLLLVAALDPTSSLLHQPSARARPLYLQISPLEELARTAAPAAPPAADRVELRDELLSLLPTDASGPTKLEGRAFEVVEALELLESVPASSGFLQLGLSGAWSLRATKAAPPEAEADEVPSEPTKDTTGLVELLGAGSSFDAGARGATTATARFRVLGDDLDGTLEVDLTAGIDPDRADTLHIVTNGRKLLMKRAPTSCDVATMMEALHANLPAEFLGDEGVRLGMQTTYLDECLRITRCTTRALAGSCAVHVRVSEA